MDISLIPLYIYKIPKDCTEILITPHIMFTKQETIIGETNDELQQTNCDNFNETESENLEVPPPAPSRVNSVGVVGCSTTILRIGEDSVKIFFSKSNTNTNLII